MEPPQFAQYPRPQGQPSGVRAQPPGIYFEAVNDGWALFAKQWTTWVAAELIWLVIAVAVYVPYLYVAHWLNYGTPGFLPSLGDHASQSGRLLSMVAALVPGFFLSGLHAGFCTMAIKQVRGETISVADLFRSFRYAPWILIIAICVRDPGALATVALGTPGLLLLLAIIVVLYPLVALAPYIIVDKRVGPFTAMRMSATALGGFVGWVAMLLLLIVLALLVAAGGLFCGLGIFLAAPVGIVTLAVHYYYYFPESFKEPQPLYGP